MYKCEYFDIKELVPESMYQKYGELSWQFFDVNLLKVLDRLREQFGPLHVNNWYNDGPFSQRGIRDFDYGGIDNRSLHKFGKAVDFHSNTVCSEDIREYILNYKDEFPEIGGMELGTSWVHIDTRNVDGIITFRPGAI